MGDGLGEGVPELARAVAQAIAQEQRDNPQFGAALHRFYAVCRTVLNPNVSLAAVEEMLVQHLLTERLLRTVFDNPALVRCNAIAAEIEQVSQALTSGALDRSALLGQLDSLYAAIEQAAHRLGDGAEKQTLLNRAYERFFQGFSPSQADTYGIVYTPQPIVGFMVASVDEVLRREFGRTLASEGVCIVDPCVGTGNFMVHIVRHLAPQTLQHKYRHELFCNEVLLLPYYIAALNIEQAYYERTQEYMPFAGLCLADTLDGTQQLALGTRAAEMTVIIGNPPYNVGQVNEQANNKNRTYTAVDRRIRETYARDSRATLHTKLYDAYVRFFRWATDCLRGGDGIVCFVSNNSFVAQVAFDGMRKHLLEDFSQVYHLDLHGNVRENPKLSGTTHNVFGIQVGVGMTLAVRKRQDRGRRLYYYRVPEHWTRREKLAWLTEKKSSAGIAWQTLQPDARHTWLTQGLQTDFATFLPMGTKAGKTGRNAEVESIFTIYSLGVSTNRDRVVYDFDKRALAERMQQCIAAYNAEVARWVRAGRPADVDSFVDYAQVKWSAHLKAALRREQYASYDAGRLRVASYRPFCRQYLYYDGLLNDRPARFGEIFPTPASEAENVVIGVTGVGSSKPFHCLLCAAMPCLDMLEKTQCFPFYIYAAEGGNRRENITDWALRQFRQHYGDAGISKWDIFYYVYALLHHPGYRARYAEHLRRELPRIPLVGGEHQEPSTEHRAPSTRNQEPRAENQAPGTEHQEPRAEHQEPRASVFWGLAGLGAKLAGLHVGYEQGGRYALEWVVDEQAPSAGRVERMRLSRDKTGLVVHAGLTLRGLPAGCFGYQLGHRSALEWVIDQYQVRMDRGGAAE